MGFALWIDRDVAWAAGTSEYRAMGAAVVSRTDLFRPADFRGDRRPPPARELTFIGHFASIGQINAYLVKERAGMGQPFQVAARRSQNARRSFNLRRPRRRRILASSSQAGKTLNSRIPL